ncbi:MAG: hypothetical protein IT165_29005 [Bryobacterales bacterium]|jgi:hypothetical protein|nr:hypothetical protein [Bryobacterales bacterium]
MGANWKPLEEKLGALRCVGFMFMGRLNGIYQYKHGISRRYLFLDYEGRAYESAGRNQFREIAFEEALERVEEPLGALGATLETPYDAAFIRRKADALKKAGIETLRIVIEPENRTV